MEYLTLGDRKNIEKMSKEGISYRDMGKVLGRSHSVISEEMAKNKMWYEKEYCAKGAHERFLTNRL